MGVGFIWRSAATALSAVGLLLVVPGAAGASQVQGQGLAYVAAPGEENHVEISYDYGAQLYRFHDSGVSSIQASGGCTVSADTASCPMDWSGHVHVLLGDENDSAVITNQLPHVQTQSNIYSGNVEMIGGGGDDVLDSGPGIPFDGDELHGDFFRIASASLWGDGFPNDALDSGQGNDVLIGGAGDDGFVGGPGNDRMVGNGGRDSFDGSPFFTNLQAVAWYSAGGDTMIGGSGSDTFDGVEGEGQGAADTITCGSGEEGHLFAGFLPGRDMLIPGDVVALGAGDSVAADCEAVAAGIECPDRLDSPCIGTTLVEGVAAGGAGTRASAASKHGGGRGTIVVGSEKFKTSPGSLIPVRVGLKPKRVNRLLGKRQSARVSQRASARSGPRHLKFRGRRFVLRRG